MALQFTRNADVYIELVGSDLTTNVATWKLSVLDGFSFTQSINSSEITINEAGAVSRRARLLFNDSLAPVEWSMSTYARPTADDTSPAETHGVEEVLWAMFMGADSYDTATKQFFNSSLGTVTDAAARVSTVAGTNETTFDFSASNVSSMSDRWNIFFAFEDGSNKQYYEVQQSVVNSVSVDFDIDGIATISWSGFGKTLTDKGTTTPTEISSPTLGPIAEGLTDTGNFIRNRISTVSLTRTDGPSPGDVFNIVLTGGNISFESNINYLTPEELGVVNAPLANITGARSISGSMTCYLDNDQANSKSGELFADLIADTDTVRNNFDLAINIGGEVASTPRLVFDLPTAHLEVPTINVEDLLTLEINFHGQVSAGNVDNTDEATIIYKS